MRRFCSQPGCPTLVDRGRCPAHQTAAKAAQMAALDPRYQTQAWRRYSRGYLAVHTRCVRCHRLSEVVDHVEPVWRAPERFFDETNHQALCIHCNQAKGYADLRGAP